MSWDAIAMYGFSFIWSKSYGLGKCNFIDAAEELKSTTNVSELPETKPVPLTTPSQSVQNNMTLF